MPRTDERASEGPHAPADLVLRNAKIYTMDSGRRGAEAIAIRGDTIVYVGTGPGVAGFVGPHTRVIDARCRMVLPSFQDCHVHPVLGGVIRRSCSLDRLATSGEYAAAVASYASRHPDRLWIVGGGWSMTAFLPDGLPDKRLLDAVVSDRPVFLLSVDGHTGWVNSKALQIAGISRETPDPPGGRIERDPQTGDPSGGLQETSAMALVLSHAPPIHADEIERGLQYSLRMLNGFGITSFQDALVTLGGSSAYRSLDAYRALDERGELTARVVTALFWDASRGEEQIDEFLRARDTYTRSRVRATSVKIWQDGILETHTASLLQPYADRPGDRGRSHVDPGHLKEIVRRLDAEGFQVHFHAIGDAAVRECLDAVEAAREANGPSNGRHHIAHLQLVDSSDIPRFRRLGVVATFQPLWACLDPQVVAFTLPLLGSERGRRNYLIRSFLRSGATVAFGSDWYVSSANPFEQIQVALTRTCVNADGTDSYLPDERIDLDEALAAFTIHAAFVNHQEDRTGSLEAGKLADLIVLDRNLFEVDPRRIGETKVLLTLVGGVPVHGDFGSLESTVASG